MADLKEIHGKLLEAINEIDAQLDSLSGGKAAGKRKIVADLTDKHSTVYRAALDDVLGFIKNLDAEKKAAVVSAFQTELRKSFDAEVSAYVEALVESQPVQEALITPEQAETLSKQRSELYQQIKAVVGVAESVGEEPLEMPSSRRGASGPRGPRNLSMFTFYINDEEVDKTIGQIAKENGYEKSADLTKALRDSGFDTKDGVSFDDFELPNGKILSGQRNEDEDEEEVED